MSGKEWVSAFRALVGVVIFGLLAWGGIQACGTTTACEKNYQGHACEVENNKAIYGSQKAAEESEHAEQVSDEAGEVEDIIKQRQAERTAELLEGGR